MNCSIFSNQGSCDYREITDVRPDIHEGRARGEHLPEKRHEFRLIAARPHHAPHTIVQWDDDSRAANRMTRRLRREPTRYLAHPIRQPSLSTELHKRHEPAYAIGQN